MMKTTIYESHLKRQMMAYIEGVKILSRAQTNLKNLIKILFYIKIKPIEILETTVKFILTV